MEFTTQPICNPIRSIKSILATADIGERERKRYQQT